MLLPTAFYPHAECIAKHLPQVEACFAPLLRWVLAWWQGSELTLAVDPTAKGEVLVALVVSVVYRGLAIPVAWRIKTGGQPGPWMPDLCALLDRLGPAVPSDLTVRVLCDRGLQSPDLWAAIRRQGWHPYMRHARHMTFQATTGPRWPAWRFVAGEGQYTVTAGEGLPRAQAALHPDRDLDAGPGGPLGCAHGRGPRRRGPRRLRDAGLDRTGLPHPEAHGLAVAPQPPPGPRPRRPALAGPGRGHPLGAGPRHARGGSVAKSGHNLVLTGPRHARGGSPPARPGPRTGAHAAPGAGRGAPHATAERVSAGLEPGPAAPAPRPWLGKGPARAPAGTGSARRAGVGGSALRVVPFLHKDADGSFTYPYQARDEGSYTWFRPAKTNRTPRHGLHPNAGRPRTPTGPARGSRCEALPPGVTSRQRPRTFRELVADLYVYSVSLRGLSRILDLPGCGVGAATRPGGGPARPADAAEVPGRGGRDPAVHRRRKATGGRGPGAEGRTAGLRPAGPGFDWGAWLVDPGHGVCGS